MAKKNELPNPLQVRELLYTKEGVDYIAYGDMFLEKGKLSDALNFYERAKSKEHVLKVKSKAISLGDAFLLGCIARILPEEVTTGDWLETGEKALALEKFLFALKAFKAAGDEEKAKEVRQIMGKLSVTHRETSQGMESE